MEDHLDYLKSLDNLDNLSNLVKLELWELFTKTLSSEEKHLIKVFSGRYFLINEGLCSPEITKLILEKVSNITVKECPSCKNIDKLNIERFLIKFMFLGLLKINMCSLFNLETKIDLRLKEYLEGI